LDSAKATILDTRVPSIPTAEIQSTSLAALNAVAWAPHSSCHICTAGDDSQALIWDLKELPNPIEEPILGYHASGEINQLQWSTENPSWIAIAHGKQMEILKI
jgi:DDB1- and CUL4-associated factor 7